MIEIYTDGSSRGNPGPGGYGAIIFHDSEVTELGGREERTTNNRMELTAVIKALEFISKLEAKSLKLEAVIHTDSEYVMKGVTEWVHNWQRKSWKTANRKPVLNQDLWRKLIEIKTNVEKYLPAGRQVEWKYVAGHAGDNLNERADEIATSFADGLEPALYHGPRDQYQ